MDAIELLKSDHKKVKQLFRKFEQAGSPGERESVAKQVFQELHVHSQLEEQIFYPAVREAAEQKGDEEEKDLVLEGIEEHHVVDDLITQLQGLDSADETYSPTFKVLTENVEHHIKEEEDELMPAARKLVGDRMDQLGDEMQELKQSLESAAA